MPVRRRVKSLVPDEYEVTNVTRICGKYKAYCIVSYCIVLHCISPKYEYKVETRTSEDFNEKKRKRRRTLTTSAD